MKKTIYFLLIFILADKTVSQCFTSATLNYYHSVAKKNDGSIWVWGAGINGQLNNGTNYDELLAIQYSSTTGWKSIFNGLTNTFAIKLDGTLWGSGSNQYGQLGTGPNILDNPNLLQIGNSNNWKIINPSSDFTIALKTDNTLWAWGHNNLNQIG